MKTIFFNRVFWQHQAFWLGVATFVSIWGLWLVCPPAVVAGNQANQALCQWSYLFTWFLFGVTMGLNLLQIV
jgi:hypothetical protein